MKWRGVVAWAAAWARSTSLQLRLRTRVRRRISGARGAGAAWEAVTGDPHVVLSWPGRGPAFVIIALEGQGSRLEPEIFFDRGQGFGDDDVWALPPCDHLTIAACLHEMVGLRRLRVDPFERHGRFRLRIYSARTRREAEALVTLLQRSVPAGRSARVEVLDDPAIPRRSFERGAVFRSVDEHFGEVVRLAGTRPAPLRKLGEPVIAMLVPVYNTPPPYLDTLLSSIAGQDNGAIEIVLSDDASTRAETKAWLDAHAGAPGVTMVRGHVNQGIARATNVALHRATTPWIALVDHDDALAPGAIQILLDAIERHPKALFFYTDEVITNGALRPEGYFLKPAFDPVLLSGINYVNHLSLYRRDRLIGLGGLRSGFDGSQDHDLLLRYARDLRPGEALHVPYPAYLWRRDGGSFSATFMERSVQSARRALADRYGVPLDHVENALTPDHHRVRFDRSVKRWPHVSVVIPNRNSLALLETVLRGLDETDYPSFDVLVVDNGSTDVDVHTFYDQRSAADSRFRADIQEQPFNFSRQINRGARLTSGEMLLFLNNDIEVVEPGWLKEMVSCFAYPDTGVVGARLLYPDRTIQHAGVVVGLGGLAGHWFALKGDDFVGPMGRLGVRQSMSAVTAAAMLVSRTCFDATGGFDEDRFAIAYNDVDFCLRAGEAGYRTVWTPFATLIHHESATRGSDEAPDKVNRFRGEQRSLADRHGTRDFEDRAFNPWYTRDRSNPIYRSLNDIPSPR